MVFTGRFSRGCFRCKKRKVKCDESKPGCRRCNLYGVICSGYPDNFAFRSENEKLKSKANWPQPAEPPLLVHCTPWDLVQAPVSIPQSLKINHEQLSLSYFVSSFVYECSEDVFRGHLDFLPQIYSQNLGECHDLATLAVSYLAAYHRWKSLHLLKEARKYYGAAMKGVQRALQSADTARCDLTFAATLLLALFVDMSDERGELAANPHLDGIYQLLLLRGPAQLSKTSLSQTLSGYAFTQLCVEYLLNRNPRYHDLPRLSKWYDQPDLLSRTRLMVLEQISLSQLLDTAAQAMRNVDNDAHISSEHTVEVMVSAIEDAVAFLQDTDHWFTDALETLASIPVFHPTKQNPLHRKGSSTSVAGARSCQILFCQDILACLYRLEELSPTHLPDSESRVLLQTWISAQTKAISDKIPVLVAQVLDLITCLSNVQSNGLVLSVPALAHLVMWPTYVIGQSAFATPIQVGFCRQMLQSIAAIGVHTAGRLLSVTSTEAEFGIVQVM